MKQRRPEPGPQIGRQIRQRQRRAGIVGAQVGREVEHAGDTETNPCLFLGREHLPQRGISELPALLAEASGEQGDSPPGHERPPERMPGRRQLQCPAGQLGSSSRVRRPEGVSGLQQGGDRGFVAGIGAVRELLGHLDGQRAPGQEHIGRLTVERPANRDGELARTASRIKSCPNASRSPLSMKMSAWTSSLIGSSRSATGIRDISARS